MGEFSKKIVETRQAQSLLFLHKIRRKHKCADYLMVTLTPSEWLENSGAYMH